MKRMGKAELVLIRGLPGSCAASAELGTQPEDALKRGCSDGV